jgi:hypothetical protein
MRSLLSAAFLTAAFLGAATIPVLSQEQVGSATLIRTAVTGSSGPVVVKSPVYKDERIRTSPSGLGEFRFTDGTKFAVGGNSSVVIDRFVYDGSKTFNKLTLNAARGSFRWISGKSKSEAYEIVTPAGTVGIRGTRLDIFVGPGGVTSIVLLDGSARFCGSNGCQDLRRRCDVVVATPDGGVSQASRVNKDIFQAVGSNQAFPFLSGRQRLSNGFYGFASGSCGLSASSSSGMKDRAGTPERSRSTPERSDRGGEGEGPNHGGGGYGDNCGGGYGYRGGVNRN